MFPGILDSPEFSHFRARSPRGMGTLMESGAVGMGAGGDDDPNEGRRPRRLCYKASYVDMTDGNETEDDGEEAEDDDEETGNNGTGVAKGACLPGGWEAGRLPPRRQASFASVSWSSLKLMVFTQADCTCTGAFPRTPSDA